MLQLLTVAPISADTMRVAKDAIPEGNTCMALRDRLGVIFDDALFAPLFPARGQPADALWRLAIVTILQFAEQLSDRDASEAVRTRIDWKYLLGLELSDSGFDHSILSRFRGRLIEGHAEMSLLDRCKSPGMLRDRSDMRTDSTHVLASIRNMNRSELVGETLRATLNVLSMGDPSWVAANVETSWYLKYARRFESDRQTQTKDGLSAAAEEVGRDGKALLERIWTEDAPPYLRSLPAVETLRQCWVSQFWEENGVLRWRHAGNLPPSPVSIDSHYDLDAHYGIKRPTEWVGYKVHLTEVCSPGVPHLITNVDTTAAFTADASHVAYGQEELAKRNLLPERQLVDSSYIGSQIVLDSRRNHGIALIGPVKQNGHRTQLESGYDLGAFKIDLEGHFAICPQGKRSTSWWSATSHTGRVTFHTKFSRTDCAKCSVNQFCTKNSMKNSRKLVLLPHEEHEWLAATRIEQRTPEWKQVYAKRAGIGGTISEGVRSVGLRRSRYRGLSKTHLQNIAVACAINLQRLTDYWSGVPPAANAHPPLPELENGPCD